MTSSLLRVCISMALISGSGPLASCRDKVPVKPTPLWTKMHSCIGKSHLSKELQEVRLKLGREFAATYFLFGVDDDLETGFFHIWRDRGVEMRFGEDGTLKYFILYARPTDTHKKYPFEMPSGLTGSDGPEQVLKKLGEPSEKNEWSWDYADRGLSVSFDASTSQGSGAKVCHVGVSKSRSKD